MRAVFLDRDGVLNAPIVRDGKPYSPLTLPELKVMPDAAPALARLKNAGYLLIVTTNQPEVSRGNQTRESVDEMNRIVGTGLPLDGFFVCWHDDRDQCHCRKPKPGLLLDAAAQFQIDLPASFMVGDRWRDIDAGAAAGCRTVLIDHHYRDKSPKMPPNFTTHSLTAAADWILQFN